MNKFFNWFEEQIITLKRMMWKIEDKLKMLWRKFNDFRK